MTTTIFWPSDVRRASGIAFGWNSPALCVAGVLDSDLESEATQVLKSVAVNGWNSPVLLGPCSFDGNDSNVLGLTVRFSGVDKFILVLYNRHTRLSLRFHALEIPRIPSLPTSSFDRKQVKNAQLSLEHESPRPMCKRGIAPSVIDHFNVALSLETALLRTIHGEEPRATIRSGIGSVFDRIFLILGPAFLSITTFIAMGCKIHTLPNVLLKDVSATVQQIDLRTEYIASLVREVEPLRRRDENASVEEYSARYISFFNTVWLILNDQTLGYALGSFLCENSLLLSQRINAFFDIVLVAWMQWVLRWLDSWPAGLKLNTELSWFLSHTFIDLIDTWGQTLHLTILPRLPIILYSFGLLSTIGGMTLAISLISDFLSILTAHVYLCYVITNFVYEKFLVTVGSLWNLFRGKRYNVLRNRLDSWEYDTDQLLFGTMLFTLVAFLFPTVLAYYSLFAVMRLITTFVNAVLDVQITFMNHFPLFALMLRVKDPWRLPGGIYIDVPPHTHTPLVIKSKPLSLSTIFVQYVQLWKILASHYNPLRLLLRLLSGKSMDPIARTKLLIKR